MVKILNNKITTNKLTQEERDLLIHFLDGIRGYERESHTNLGFDERDSSEFVDIYERGCYNEYLENS